MTDGRIPVAILGSTGVVGQEFVRMLTDHPWFDPIVLGGSRRTAGRSYREVADWALGPCPPAWVNGLPVLEADPDTLVTAGVRLVFSALPSSVAAEAEPALRNAGLAVFTNAGALRGSKGVPILVPEVNAAHLTLTETGGRNNMGCIVAGPNCSTSGLAMVLGALREFNPRTVYVSTYQSISGAGRRGLAAWDITGNVVPYIGSEEEKMERETITILGPPGKEAVVGLEVHAKCARVPVRVAHLESAVIEFADPPTEKAAQEALQEFRGSPELIDLPTAPDRPIVYRSEPDRPQPVMDAWAGEPERARGMAVSVGRLRQKSGRLHLYLLVHNTVRGAAGGCLLNAELAYRKGMLG